MTNKSATDYRLKEAVQIADAAWVAHLERQAAKWEYKFSYRVSKARMANLIEYLRQASVDSWLCGALGSRSSR